MRRVVITGLGIISCLGNGKKSVTQSLSDMKSGIKHDETFAQYGFRSQVSGRPPALDFASLIDRKLLRFMGDASAYAYLSLQEALADSGLEESMISHPRSGIIMGSGGASCANVVETADIMRSKGVKRVGAFMVPRTMGSTVSACLATAFHIKGINYSISSACATSAHCIGAGMEQIQLNKQDIVFAGGAEELHWSMSSMFDAMGALSTKYNATPEQASRAYDADRDGFVIAGGAGSVVLEEYEHAKKRGAKIYAEVVGYAATSDGDDMVAPSGEGAERCIRLALDMAGVDTVDYINAHGTSTPAGDITELQAIAKVLDKKVGAISSTKSLSGHSLGAAGVQETIYSILMMENNFITGSANIYQLDPGAHGFPVLRETIQAKLRTILSNSFGFGGTNATLALQRVG